MIARVWKGTSTPALADAYVSHLREQTFPQLTQIAGHRGAFVQRRTSSLDSGTPGEFVEFVVTTFWESLDAIARFSGDDPEVAVVPDAARRLLRSWDERAVHWEVVLSTVSALDNPRHAGA